MPNATPNSLRVAVAGVTGYAGAELARILLDHPRFRTQAPIFLGRPASEGGAAIALTSLHPQLSGLPNTDGLSVIPFDWNELQREGVELLFLATPHEQSREWAQQALAHGIRVVDLSAAWRLDTPAYRAIYKLEDTPATDALQTEAVYGSPELHGAEIAKARLVANPGCYATSVILALSPLVRANIVDLSAGIIADAKSGVSGAGKAPSATTHFMYAADNLSAYAVFGHRHTGELYEQLQLQPDQIQFTPHLLPIPRGILSTVYVRFAEPQTLMSVQALFNEFYRDAPLVRVRQSPMLPQIQHVVRTSFCDIGFQLSPDGKRAVIIACLDNLLKGAASQAVENMNLMAGWPQQEGLI
ncbi:MAG: N-acetyl-gamma-glutamyl-phosphate reductase [Acidobacteriaceae bacterium]|nr:N-acetyl-gamma-glutamyl-phosphate reductase [Acidobacteriaceae bacterium]